MMMKRLMNRAERKSYDELDRDEQVCIFLRDNPQCLTERLTTEIAARFLNVVTIRLMIRKLYPRIVQEYVENNNFVIIPEHTYE
jgi:hypothetical protein